MKESYQIYGLRAVIEAIIAGKSVDNIFIKKNMRGELFSELVRLIKKEHISCSYVPVEKLNRLSKQNHQGVVAIIAPIQFHDFETLLEQTIQSKEIPLFLLLDQICDVRNFGAIIRTAQCTGVHGIVIQKNGTAPVNADTVKTSAGAIFNVPICKVDHLKDAIYYLQASEISVIAATEKASHTIYSFPLQKSLALIMGSESKGINPSLLKMISEKAKLPVYGSLGSLNVSVACGAFLYEIIRQRTTYS